MRLNITRGRMVGEVVGLALDALYANDSLSKQESNVTCRSIGLLALLKFGGNFSSIENRILCTSDGLAVRLIPRPDLPWAI